MLIVRDFDKLKKNGFEQTSEEKNVWVKCLSPVDKKQDGVYVELVVNPLTEKCEENEMLVYFYADTSDFHGRTEVDQLYGLEEVFELLMEGVLLYVPDRGWRDEAV